MDEGVINVARVGLTALQNLGFAVLVGALLSDAWLKRGPSQWQAEITAALANAFRVAAIAALSASVFYFWIHCAQMAEVPLDEAWPAVLTMLRETEFGHAWAVCTVCMVGVAALAFPSWGAQPRGLRAALWLALGGAALARSHGGHPVDAGAFSLPVWADWMHLLAISTWVGLVMVAGCIVMPRIVAAAPDGRSNGAVYVRALSNAATLALGVLVATGAYGGWRAVGTPANLLGASYGRLLLLKLALVMMAAALGGYNRFAQMPGLLARLSRPGGAREIGSGQPFITVLRIEAFVLSAVLIVAAVLVGSALPGTE